MSTLHLSFWIIIWICLILLVVWVAVKLFFAYLERKEEEFWRDNFNGPDHGQH